MIRNLGSQILKAQGYTVIVAEDGRVAIDIFLARQKEIDLVLLDLTMPNMSGLEVLERIRAIDPLVKVVLSSGYRAGEEDDSDRFSEASAFLSKPYRAASLVRIVRDVLDRTSP
jgi:CheY-like chemotaxis protein